MEKVLTELFGTVSSQFTYFLANEETCMNIDEVFLIHLIQNCCNGSSDKHLIVKQYVLEAVGHFIKRERNSQETLSIVIGFLLQQSDDKLKHVVLNRITELVRLKKISNTLFQPVLSYLLKHITSSNTSEPSDDNSSTKSLRMEALDALISLLLHEDADVSESLFRITDHTEAESNHSFSTILASNNQITASLIPQFLSLLNETNNDPECVKRYLEVVAALTVLAARVSSPLPAELLADIISVCDKMHRSSDSCSDVKYAAGIAMACLGEHSLTADLSESLWAMFSSMNQVGETSSDGTTSAAGKQVPSEEEQQHIRYNNTTVAIALQGFSALLLHKNIPSPEKVAETAEIILRRTELTVDSVTEGHDPLQSGYLTSSAFLGVRRLLELGILASQRVETEVLDILVRGTNYDLNVHGRSRSSARLALAELVKTGHYPKHRRAELLSILATKKAKGFSDHNLQPTPKEKLVSVAIEILNGHE